VAATRWIPETPPQPGNAATAERAVRTAVSGKLNSLEKTTFYDFRVSDVYKCPVFGAKRNDYNVSEVKHRRDRSNELYEQVAALG
jgi:hypothetical protein